MNIVLDEGQSSFRGVILAHELVHVLQQQELHTPYPNVERTIEGSNTGSALFEGDANYVAYLYQQRCESDWDCVSPEQKPMSRSDSLTGLALLNQVQYANGPTLVHSLKRQGGWKAVNDAYQNPPESTEQIIHPEKYLEDAPQDVSVADRSGEDWQPLTVSRGRPTQEFGEAGLFTTLWFPSYKSGETVVMAPNAHINRSQVAFHPYDYDHELSAGWDGDQLVPYVSENASANETAFVWRIEWDSPTDAAEFKTAYETILAHRNATAVSGRANTLRIPDSEPFGDAFSVIRNGSSIVIVNAPTVDDLSEVRSGAAPATNTTETTEQTATPTETATPTATATTTATATPTDTPTDTATDSSIDSVSETTEMPTETTQQSETSTETPTTLSTATADGPGFGLGLVLLAIASVTLLGTRRHW